MTKEGGMNIRKEGSKQGIQGRKEGGNIMKEEKREVRKEGRNTYGHI